MGITSANSYGTLEFFIQHLWCTTKIYSHDLPIASCESVKIKIRSPRGIRFDFHVVRQRNMSEPSHVRRYLWFNLCATTKDQKR